jgi:hypothetical protein
LGILGGIPGQYSHAFQSTDFIAALSAKCSSKNDLKSSLSIDLNLNVSKYFLRNGSNWSKNNLEVKKSLGVYKMLPGPPTTSSR